MATPQPQSDLQIYEKKLSEAEYLVFTNDDRKAFALAKIKSDIEKIKDVGTRFWLLSNFYTLKRDQRNVIEAIKNLRGNNYEGIADLAEMQSAVNNGYGSRVVQSARKVLENRSAISWVEVFQGLYLTGQFSLLDFIYNKVRMDQEIKDPDFKMMHFLKAVEISKEIGFSEELATKMHDIFGELMRAEGLYWTTDWKDIKYYGADKGGPSILLQYGVYLNAVEAARLNRKISQAFAENDISFPGVAYRVKPRKKMSESEQLAALAELI